MKHVYKAALRLSYLISDLAEFILDPIANAVWNLGGRIEYWANEKLTKLEAAEPLVMDERYRESHEWYLKTIRELDGEFDTGRFKGMTSAQAYDLLKKEQG